MSEIKRTKVVLKTMKNELLDVISHADESIIKNMELLKQVSFLFYGT